MKKLALPLPRFRRITFRLTHAFHLYSFELGYLHYADCDGVLSRFRNTKLQAIFADFDTGPQSQAEVKDPHSLEEIEGDLLEGASHIEGLGSFFIFESSKNHYHAIDFSLHDVLTIRRFLAGLRYGDYKYVAGFMRHGENTIRISPKKNEKDQRAIRFAKFLGREHDRSLLHHNGLLQLYEDLHPEIKQYTSGLNRDGSNMDDLAVFNYKTIVW